MQILNNLNLNKNSLMFALNHPLAAAPATPGVGQMYFDTVTLQPLNWTGAAWTNLATNSPLLNGQNAAFYLSRANHTGSQLSATISDLATTVQAYRLNQFVAPNAAVSMGSQLLTNLADPVSAQDAATMNYVQTQVANAAAGIDAKASVRIATTANDTLSGLAARDGITPVANDRVLVKNQTTGSANGVYLANAAGWTRATDADASAEMTPGAFWYVEEGTAAGKTQWRLENTGAIVLGTTTLTINQFGGAGVIYTAGNGISLGGNAITAVAVASGGISVVAGGLQVDTAIVARKFSGSYGNGSLTSLPVVHNLGTKDVVVNLRLVADDSMIITDWVATDVNTVTLTFAVAPAASAIRCTVLG